MRDLTTTKVLSLARTESLLTSVIRAGIFFSLPYMGVALICLLVTMVRIPVFGVALLTLGAFYLPLIFMSRPSRVRIDATGKVQWTPGRVVNRALLKSSLLQVGFFIVAMCLLALGRG